MAKKKATETHPNQIDNGLRADLGTLANELRLRTEERDRVASERGRWSNLLKQADEAVELATAAIVAASRPGQMPLIPAAADREDDAGKGNEPEILDDRTTLSGTTGAPIGDGPSYEMTPSAENPAECICGWEIASPIAGHDRRHAQFVRAIEEESAEKSPDGDRAYREKTARKKAPRAKKPLGKKVVGKKKAVRR